uniref:Uncharacterized protein n=1 Tax=Cyprinodon variegatus TaxID=28743 RepID=A0A3Q2CMM5_CYPVA
MVLVPNFRIFCIHEIKLDQSASVEKRPGESVKMSCVASGYSMTDANIDLTTIMCFGLTKKNEA